MQTSKVRVPTVAGQFYENNPNKLISTIKNFTRDFHSDIIIPPNSEIFSLIVPHAGYVFSGKTAATAMSLAKNKKYKQIVLIAPTHNVSFTGIALSSYDSYNTPIGNISVAKNLIENLTKKKWFKINNRVHDNEHSLEVQLPLIKHYFPDTPILPLICGNIDTTIAKEIAETLQPLWNNETLWIVSSDFTHYGQQFNYLPFKNDIPENLKKLDGGAIEKILNIDSAKFIDYVSRTGATICGRNPINIMLNVAESYKNKSHSLQTKLIDYTTSGELTGDFRHCVSYAGIIFYG